MKDAGEWVGCPCGECAPCPHRGGCCTGRCVKAAAYMLVWMQCISVWEVLCCSSAAFDQHIGCQLLSSLLWSFFFFLMHEIYNFPLSVMFPKQLRSWWGGAHCLLLLLLRGKPVKFVSGNQSLQTGSKNPRWNTEGGRHPAGCARARGSRCACTDRAWLLVFSSGLISVFI